MNERQYVEVQFGTSSRIYTYHNDGAPLAVGQQAQVETKHGLVTVTVTGIRDEPPFATKPAIAKENAE
jgi:hypothetical protein